jgi:hypothetical protein
VLAGGSGPGDEAGFHPGKHAILTKAFAEDLALEMDSFDFSVDGQPVQQDMPEVRVQAERRFTLGDEYLEVEDGRVKKLLRTHERISGASTASISDGEEEEHTAQLTSELEDAVVRFEWNEERQEYDRSFEEGGTGVEEHLNHLEPEADFLAFLPQGPVDKDDAWEVDASALGRVFAPGGDLRLTPASLGDEPYVEMEMPPMIGAAITSLAQSGSAWEGTIKAKYAGAAEEDGVRLGRIELEVDATAEVDLTDLYARSVESLGQDFGFTFDEMRLRWKLSGRGHLLWDLAGGHAHAFELESDADVEAHLGWKQRVADREVGIESVYRLSGASQVKMALER